MRIHKVNVAGCADGLAELLAEPDNLAVNLPEVVDILEDTLAEHKGVVARGLNFEVIVERSNSLYLSPRRVFENTLVELSLAARRADYQPFPVLNERAFEDSRFFIEGFKVAFGNQLVEIF